MRFDRIQFRNHILMKCLLDFFCFQWTYIKAGLVAFIAFILAYALGLIELNPGGTTRVLWS